MSSKENNPETTSERSLRGKGDTAQDHSERDCSGESDCCEANTKTQMESCKNAKETTGENSTKKSADLKETTGSVSGSEKKKGKGKDAGVSVKEGAGSLTEGFCGFEETDSPKLIRSTREASKNATAILTRKSTSKLEKSEGKSDSPPDLVLFLKEGRGRAQNYSDPPRLDPETIATRRRTRVPEDPVVLISKTKSALATETVKKDQKESGKKERKTKVMETPESLKRLAREGSKILEACGKEASDSGTEWKTLQKTYSKGESEKVRCVGTPTGPVEELPANITKRGNRVKKDCVDEPEMELMGELVRTGSPAEDSPDISTNYSNLGTILNKMTRNNADKRIPVVIMSKSEKKTKIDIAKPRSKKKINADESLSTAVLKIASPAVPAVETSDSDEESFSEIEGDCNTPKSEVKRCEAQPSKGANSDSEPDHDVIVVKVTSDLNNEGKNIVAKTKDKTDGSNSNDPGEKVQTEHNTLLSNIREQAKTGTLSYMKETVAVTETKLSVSKTVQERTSSPVKFSSVFSSIKPSLVASSTKPNLVISSVKPDARYPRIRPKPITSTIKPSVISLHAKPNPIPSSIRSTLGTSPIKPSSVISPIVSSPITSSIKSSIVASPLKSGSVMSHLKYKSLPSPTKSGYVTSSNPQSQKTPSLVVSMSQLVSYGGAKRPVKGINMTPGKIGPKVSPAKGTSTVHTLKKDMPSKQESSSDTSIQTDIGAKGDRSESCPVSTHLAVSNLSSQRGPMLDYTDIETQEVILGENEDSNTQMDSVGALPAEPDLLAREELESSSEEDTLKFPESSSAAKKESLSPEGRVALDHSYSSGGSTSSRKKSPSTYEKSLTPRPVYSNPSAAKRSLDIMLHNDKINILRQMSQIFNDEKPPQQISDDEKAVHSEADITVSSSDGEDEDTNVSIRKTKEIIPHESTDTSKGTTEDSSSKGTSSLEISKAKMVEDNNASPSECTSKSSSPCESSAVAENPKTVEDTPVAADASTSSEGVYSCLNQENRNPIECTPPMKGRIEDNSSDDAYPVGLDSPFLGFPDPDPKVHHVPAYSLAFNEKIQVQSKIGPAGEMIDIVDGFSFTSFTSEVEMMAYGGTCRGRTTKIRQWLKKKWKKRRKKLMRRKEMQGVCPKVPGEEPESLLDIGNYSAGSPKEKSTTADYGAFASDDLDSFLDNNSRLNISYSIPKCKVTEEGVSKIDDEIEEEAALATTQTSPPSPPSPHFSPPSPGFPHEEMMPTDTQPIPGVNPNTSAMEQHSGTNVMTEPVDQYEEVNAIDILYPKEKYKYYYNKELCKETKADGSDVFVRRAGKLVPLTTVLKSQKCLVPELNIKKTVELVYIYDGGKLLTLGGSLTKINPSNSDSVKARVVLPIGVPPIPKGETLASNAKKVQAVEINEDMAKFALSALQHSPIKREDAVDKINSGERECSPLPGPSSGSVKDEHIEGAIPEATPTEKTEIATVPKPASLSVSIKPTKRNILDIIAAKLAMSDDESDEKEETEMKETATKPLPKEESEDTNKKNRCVENESVNPMTSVIKNKNMETEPSCLIISEKSLVEPEDLKEEMCEDLSVTKPQTVKEGEAVELKSEVKPKKEENIVLSENVDNTCTKERTLTERNSVDTLNVEEEKHTSELLIVRESSKIKQGAETNCVADGATWEEVSEKKDIESKSMVLLEKEKKTQEIFTDDIDVNKVSNMEYEKASIITFKEKEKKGNFMALEECKEYIEEKSKKTDVVVIENEDLCDKAADQVCERKDKMIPSGKVDKGLKHTLENLKGKVAGVEEGAETESDSALCKTKEETETPVAAVSAAKASGKRSSEACMSEVQHSIKDEDVVILPESDSKVLNVETTKTLLSPSQQSGVKIHLEEKEKSELGTQEAFRMDVKSRVFKKNMYRFPSLSREMKRLNMNFVNYEPPVEELSETEEEVIPDFKEDCDKEHCKLGCICDSLMCQRKSVEHCGRVECMFVCTCRDESWKLPSGSGRTMNAVSIYNLDREQKEGLALREKDFRRTVIQTGSEVILVGAERKKREIRLPGRYRETDVWSGTDLPTDEECFPPHNLPMEPDYPGIPLSEASKYIKRFKLNIPWYDIKGISVWCMDHSCYDCRCLSDPTFNDHIKVESVKKSASLKAKPEPCLTLDEPLLRVKPEFSLPKTLGESPPTPASALVDLEEALRQKADLESMTSPDDKEVKKPVAVADARCSIMNIIVNNSETRRRYTWKLKEWTHDAENFCARTAGYSKKKVTEETKDIVLSGQATPQQVVESVVKSLRQEKASNGIKMPTLPCSKNFEPFMGDSLVNLQNAIGFYPDNTNKPSGAETPCPLVDLTNGNEEINAMANCFAKSRKGVPRSIASSGQKQNLKRKLSESVEPPVKKTPLSKPDDTNEVQGGSSTQQSVSSHKSTPKELASFSELGPKKTLSLLEMMVAEENRGELELDLSNNIPGNALLVAEARFRKLINMNIIGVIGINKAGRCIIGTVDSDEALQVMHQIQNMIRNNTLDVGPNMREIFFPPPYVGIRPRYVMIRCDFHHKWEIVGVVQKKGPVRSPGKPTEHKTKANSSSKQVPQVIDLEEEERQKQLLEVLNNIKQEQIDLIKQEVNIVEPPSPEEKDGGTWEGSLPLIASVHSASDSNMAELMWSPETIREELEESQVTPTASISSSVEISPTKKAIPDLFPISSSSAQVPSHKEEQTESLSAEVQPTESGSVAQQKLFLVPTAINVSKATTPTLPTIPSETHMKSITVNVASNKVFGNQSERPTIPSETPMKSITLNVASNKVFGNQSERPQTSPKPFSYGNVSYILPKLPSSGKNDPNMLLPTQKENKNAAVSQIGEGCDMDLVQTSLTPTSPSSKMLYIPVTSGGVSKVLLVSTVSGGSSSQVMLLPTLPSTSSMENGNTSTATTTTTMTTTPITSTTAATIPTSKVKMVLVPSPLDNNKMLLIPAPADSNDSSTVNSSLENPPTEGEKKKMLVLPSSVIGNITSRSPSSEPASTELHQQACEDSLHVPLVDTGNLSNTSLLNEGDNCSQSQLKGSHSQDRSIDVTSPTTIMGVSSESFAVREEIPSSFISPPPIASSSVVAETNVVSSLTTISSTMPENSSLPEVESELDSGDPSLIKQTCATGLNTLFDKTHEEMISGTKPAESAVQESLKEVCEDEKGSQTGSTKVIVRCQGSDTIKEKEVLDHKKVLIKKGGFHWSAVDLSLNFKSVKLEWLLGTIRKSVLMNIYQMSKKTHSPVTLSVKNDTSTSMLYGFARTCKRGTLPVLILGSVVSAVLSSSSVPNSMLFQINSIKYFIRESTGELSSYTYASEHHLVKLASKKKGNSGEMLGIGEQIEIWKMREPQYQTLAEKAATEAGKLHGSFTSVGHLAQAKRGSSHRKTENTMLLEQEVSSASASSSLKQGMENTSAYTNKDSSKSTLLENYSLPSSLAMQDNSAPSMHIQEREKIPVKSKLPVSAKKYHSELRHILTKAKEKSQLKKALQRISKREGIAFQDEKCQTAVGKQAIAGVKGKRKISGDSYTSVDDVSLHESNLVKSEDIILPKSECEAVEDEGDVDVLGDTDSTGEILCDLRQQLEHEVTQVQKILDTFTSKESGKRKGMNTPVGGPPLKKARTELSRQDVEHPCPLSRKPSVAGKIKNVDADEVLEMAVKDHQDTVDSSSKCTTESAHAQSSGSGESSVVVEEEDSDSCALSKEKMCSLSIKQLQLNRMKQKEKMLLDGDFQSDERNSDLHNKLERMRRRVMKHLFVHLQRVIVKTPRNPLITHTISHAKKTILCAGQRVCMTLKNEELRLMIEEEKIRSERSTLIKHLASIIGDSTEEIKLKWRHWVADHMQSPTARQTFENTWQPFSLENDILKNALEEKTFDIDYDEGSPLPQGSPMPSPSSSHEGGLQLPEQKRKRVYRKGVSKRGKKLGRPSRIVVNTGHVAEPSSSETTGSIPTSILLMAGTSSRGRKIVRKEDINFIT